LSNPANASEIALIVPLLGDPTLGRWPWSDPFGIPEQAGREWLTVLSSYAIPVDDTIRRFVRTLFRTRRRKTWIAAADAIAAIAKRDDRMRDELAAAWHRVHPSGPRFPVEGPDVHLGRHMLYLGCRWTAIGGAPSVLSGFQPDRFAATRMPTQDSDRSVWAEGLRALLDGPSAPGIRAALPDRAAELGPDVLTEEVFRRLLERVDGDAADAIRTALISPRWKPHRIDALDCWVETARWFAARDDHDAVDQMLAHAGLARPAIEVASQRRHGTMDELIDELRIVLDADRSAVVGRQSRAARIEHARALMRLDHLRDVPMDAIVRLAGAGASSPLTGTVGEVGEAELMLQLTRMGLPLATAMRGAVLPPSAVLHIANEQHGFVATQVALQAERVLRELDTTTDAAQEVRFVWRLLRRDPPTRTLTELARVIRSDAPLHNPEHASERPLRLVVECARDLDRARDTDEPLSVQNAAFAELLRRTGQVVSLAGEKQLLDLADAVQDEPDIGHPVPHLTRILLGDGPGGGLLGWSAWLNGSLPPQEKARRLAVEASLSRLGATLRRLDDARPCVDVEHHSDVQQAEHAVREAVGPLGWPLEHPLDTLLGAVAGLRDDALTQGRRSVGAEARLAAAMARGDEAEVRRLLTDQEKLSLLPASMLHRSHRFLLDQLLIRDARALRNAVARRVVLQSPAAWLMPLYVAVAGGSFLVLDVGGEWLRLATVSGESWRYGTSIALAGLASYALLVVVLGQRMTGTAPRRWVWAVVRVAPIYLLAAALSAVVSGVVMATLGGHGIAELPMWTALALFLGVFVGLVFQGQSLTRRDS
jgi:hypothetical protein